MFVYKTPTKCLFTQHKPNSWQAAVARDSLEMKIDMEHAKTMLWKHDMASIKTDRINGLNGICAEQLEWTNRQKRGGEQTAHQPACWSAARGVRCTRPKKCVRKSQWIKPNQRGVTGAQALRPLIMQNYSATLSQPQAGPASSTACLSCRRQSHHRPYTLTLINTTTQAH